MNNSFRNRRPPRGVIFLVAPILAFAVLAIGGWVVMYLWNAIIPGVIKSVGTLTYWQAVGLFVLCRLLFGSFKGGRPGRGFGNRRFGGGSSWREKMMNMSDEEREKFRAEWKERCRNKFNK